MNLKQSLERMAILAGITVVGGLIGTAIYMGTRPPQKPEKIENPNYVWIGILDSNSKYLVDLNRDKLVDLVTKPGSNFYHAAWVAPDMVEEAKKQGFSIDGAFTITPRMSPEMREAGSRLMQAINDYTFATAQKKFDDYHAKK